MFRTLIDPEVTHLGYVVVYETKMSNDHRRRNNWCFLDKGGSNLVTRDSFFGEFLYSFSVLRSGEYLGLTPNRSYRTAYDNMIIPKLL